MPNRPISSPILTPMQPLHHPLFEQAHIQVWIKRDDLNHPTIQGNKWHKLNLNLQQATREGKDGLITYGGAFSNHIAATAAAGNAFGFKTIGIIRGDELAEAPKKWSQTLTMAQENGMQLQFLSRKAYREKDNATAINDLAHRYPNYYRIPEGGTNALAVDGLKPLANDIDQQCPNWTHLYTAMGTGGTLAGLVKHLTLGELGKQKQVVGVPTASEFDYLINDINAYLTPECEQRWTIAMPSIKQRYGKITPEIKAFMQFFKTEFNVQLDPIYTARMVMEFWMQVESTLFLPGAKIILLHTGGLQGLITKKSD